MVTKKSTPSTPTEPAPMTTIVVPTFNESDNVKPLVERVRHALAGRPAEILFVDDSTDLRTIEAIDAAAGLFANDDFLVKSYHRTGEKRWGGLSGAVTDGIANASSDQIIVMDGDLQHPPETIPALIDKAAEGHDVVVASRYCKGGTADGLDGGIRHLVSRGSTLVAKGFFPKRLKHVTDPMTGFFLVDRRALDLSLLRPKGFKILLEILARHRDLRVTEVPFQFAERLAGESKGTIKQGLQYMSQLVSTKHANNVDDFCRLPKLVQFGVIGGSVFGLGMVLLAVLVEVFHWDPRPANAVQLAMTFALNYLFNRNLTWRDRAISRLSSLKFFVSRGITTVLNYQLFAWLLGLQLVLTVADRTFQVNFHYAVANTIALVVIMLLNYVISDLWAFADVDRKKAKRLAKAPAAAIAEADAPVAAAVVPAPAPTVVDPIVAAVEAAEAASRVEPIDITDTVPARAYEPKTYVAREPRKVPSARRSMITSILWASLAGALIAWGIRTDLNLTVSILLALAGLAMSAQSAMEVWRMMYAYREPEAVERLRFPAAADRTNEKFALIVPARHEDAVLADTLNLLSQQTHPNVHIISVECDDDYDTIKVARAVAETNPRVEVILYPLLPGTKPSKPLQMNYVLDQIKDRDFTVIGVIDAEDTVAPDLLKRVDAAFADRSVDIVQGGVQLMNHDSSWYSLHNVLEYYKWFNSAFAYHADKEFVPLGGNTVFIRHELLQLAGGWPTTLTEDCSLGVLLSTRYDAKTAVYYEPQLATQEETPDTLQGLFKQRVRWNQGFYGEWRKGVWRELPTLGQRLLAAYVLLSPVILAWSTIMLAASLTAAAFLDAPVGLVMLMYVPLVPMILLLALNAVFLYDFGKAFDRKVRIRSYAMLFATYFLYQIVLNAAALWSIVRELRGDQSWHKTAHSGLHRREPAFATADATVIVSDEE